MVIWVIVNFYLMYKALLSSFHIDVLRHADTVMLVGDVMICSLFEKKLFDKWLLQSTELCLNLHCKEAA